MSVPRSLNSVSRHEKPFASRGRRPRCSAVERRDPSRHARRVLAVGVAEPRLEQPFLPPHDRVVLEREQHDDDRREPEQPRRSARTRPRARCCRRRAGCAPARTARSRRAARADRCASARSRRCGGPPTAGSARRRRRSRRPAADEARRTLTRCRAASAMASGEGQRERRSGAGRASRRAGSVRSDVMFASSHGLDAASFDQRV